MPDLRAMSGKPLPVADLAPGTVTVRVARKLPVNSVVGAGVAGISTNAGGDSRRRTVTTGEDGRATFEGISPGSMFKAEVTVDGERLQTAEFSIPAQGGTRVMLLAGLGADEGGQGAAPDEGDPFARAAVTGSVAPQEGLPPGTLDISIVDGARQPVAGREVSLGEVREGGAAGGRQVVVHKATSDGAGVAHFSGLPRGGATGYAAVVDHEGMRLATGVFRMPDDKGARGTIHALARTDDATVLRVDARSRLILDAREDALAIMENLLITNPSDKIFDASGKGFVIPLPDGFVGAQEIAGGVPVEVRAREGMAIRAAVPPNSAAAFATQVRFGFVLPARGSATLQVKQRVPVAMEGVMLLVPANTGFTIDAPGSKRLADDTDAQGNKVYLYALGEVQAGGVLSFSVSGLPSRDKTGRNVASALVVMLVLATVLFARPPEQAGRTGAGTRQALVDRREKLFAELVQFERGGAGSGHASSGGARRDIVTRLENVYRELAAHERAGDARG